MGAIRSGSLVRLRFAGVEENAGRLAIVKAVHVRNLRFTHDAVDIVRADGTPWSTILGEKRYLATVRLSAVELVTNDPGIAALYGVDA